MDRPRLVAAAPARPERDFQPRDPSRIARVRAVRRVRDRVRVDAEDDRGRRVPIELRPVAPTIIRVHVGSLPRRPSRLLVESAPATTEWELAQTATGWELRTTSGTLALDRDPYRLRLLDRAGRECFAEEPWDRDIRGGFHHFPSGHARGLRWMTARLLPEEALFGLGEHFGPLNRRGQAFASWTVDAFGVRSDRAYKNVPLLLSTAGYALFFDMTGPLFYDLGRSSTAAWQVAARADHLRAYLILGESPAEQIHAYHALTGVPSVPPAWSFGLWMSRWGYRNREEVIGVARRMRAEGVPCDVIHIDPYWMRYHEGHHADLTWDEQAFPDPAGMMAELRAMGFRVSLWESPYVPLDSDLCAEGRRHGYLVKDRAGQPALVTNFSKPSAAVDFTNPAAVAWFQSHNRKLLEQGAAVMKADFAEDLPKDAVLFDGTPAEDVHNLYPLLYQRAVFEVTEAVHGRGIIWSRSAYAGSHRYPVQWGGDPGCSFADMAASLRGALSWILSGAAFASFDMGGFFGIPRVQDPPSPELYVRWSQMGLLFSHARAHGHTAPREPWEYGARALDIFRRYARLRYRLLPYLYSAALRAPEGIPLVRPLVFDHPDDRTTHNLDDEYFLGPDLLIAPLFQPEGTRMVYLPEGDWYDFGTDVPHAGSRWVERHAELETLPIYVRAGAVIPQGPDLSFSDESPWEPLTFDVYPGPQGEHRQELHHDAGRVELRLTTTDRAVRLEATSVPFPAGGGGSGRGLVSSRVRVHRGTADVREGRLGEAIPLD